MFFNNVVINLWGNLQIQSYAEFIKFNEIFKKLVISIKIFQDHRSLKTKIEDNRIFWDWAQN